MNVRKKVSGLLAVFAMLAVSVVVPASASAEPASNACANRNINQIDKFLSCIDGDDVMVHLEALQNIADANGGVRNSGTPGYDESADYVVDLLEDAGFEIERQVFSFSLFSEISAALTADGSVIETQTMSFSGSGFLEDATPIAVDLDLGLDNSSSSGCEATDFDGLDFSGDADVAIIQRGTCAFGTKALNAQAAGAEAVVIFNQGNADGRFDIIGGTLGEDVVDTLTIPVLDVAYDDGITLISAESIDVDVQTTIENRTTENVIADLPGNNPDNVVMAGAHLDSVDEGPGINDNGSGSGVLLTIALAMGNNKQYTPENTVRFAWWGAEESGLIGSTEYIFNPDFGITDEEYEALSSYLNFDMVGSPNFIYGVYDADESSFEATAPVPEGSAALEDIFEAFYTIEGIPYEDSEFSGRSDYQAFIDVGIPASGLFTGAEGIKTDEQAEIWGGTAGDQFDPCYHLACDTIDNPILEALDVNVDAVGYAMYILASTTEAVNGVEGAPVVGTTPDEVTLDGPQGTFVTGGGLDHSKASATTE